MVQEIKSRKTKWLFVVVFVALGLIFIQRAGLLRAEEGAQEAKSAIMQSMIDNPVVPQELEAINGMVACDGTGHAGVYPCNNIDLMAFMPNGSMGGGGTNDVWGWTSPTSGKEYALVGMDNGTAFVDMSDPENPIYLGKLATETSSSTWRDIKVYQDYAYIVSEASGHGVQIFDLTKLDSVLSPPVVFVKDGWYNGSGANTVSGSHNIVINEDSGFAFVVGGGCSAGLTMIDLSNATSPTFAGCFSADGYTHDAHCVNYNGPDADYAGAEICLAANEDTLTIVDVTDKASPVMVSRSGYANAKYTHQTWFTEDHKYALVGDELDESNLGFNTRTFVWDLTDLDNPTMLSFYNGANASIDHNLYVKGDYVYESNYTSGLQILSLGGAKAFGITGMYGYFDTYTPSNSASFSGSWSNYPYFGSGNVVVTSRGEGIFIVRPNFAPTAVSMQASDVDAPAFNMMLLVVPALLMLGSVTLIGLRAQSKRKLAKVMIDNN